MQFIWLSINKCCTDWRLTHDQSIRVLINIQPTNQRNKVIVDFTAEWRLICCHKSATALVLLRVSDTSHQKSRIWRSAHCEYVRRSAHCEYANVRRAMFLKQSLALLKWKHFLLYLCLFTTLNGFTLMRPGKIKSWSRQIAAESTPWVCFVDTWNPIQNLTVGFKKKEKDAEVKKEWIRCYWFGWQSWWHSEHWHACGFRPSTCDCLACFWVFFLVQPIFLHLVFMSQIISSNRGCWFPQRLHLSG